MPIALTGVLESITIEITGSEGIMVKTWINGEGYTWDFPSIPSDKRASLFTRFNEAIGCQVWIMSSPPDGFVFKANDSVIQIGRAID